MARADNRRQGRRQQPEPEPEAAVEAAPKSRTTMWIVITLSTLLLLGGGGAGAYYFLFAEDDPLGILGGAGGDAAAEARRPPIYYSLDPAFVNNLSGTGGRRFMQVEVQLMARDPEVIAAVERHEPVVRNDLIMLFSDQTLESVDTTAGKEALREESLEAIRRILRRHDEPDEVEDLFFTSIIVQ